MEGAREGDRREGQEETEGDTEEREEETEPIISAETQPKKAKGEEISHFALQIIPSSLTILLLLLSAPPLLQPPNPFPSSLFLSTLFLLLPLSSLFPLHSFPLLLTCP